MFAVTERSRGLTIKLEGLLNLEEMRSLAFQLQEEWTGLETPFVYVIDARGFQYFTAESQALFEETLEAAVESGLVRISVLALTTSLANLFCSIMVRSDLMDIYQFLDLEYEDDPDAEMNFWLNEPFINESHLA